MPELMVGTLPKAKLDVIAKQKLNEDSERLESDLQAIKDWIKKQPHLDGYIPTGKLLKFIFLNRPNVSLNTNFNESMRENLSKK